MHAAAIRSIPARGWNDGPSFLERDISRDSRLFGRSGAAPIYARMNSPEALVQTRKKGSPNKQKSIDFFWDRWVEEASLPKPPGTQIHTNQMVRKYSVDNRFGAPQRPPSRMPVSFGYTPQERFMEHSYHSPEITSRIPGIAATPCDPPRTPAYWKCIAPHLDEEQVARAFGHVTQHGSVASAVRATTPSKPYKLKYVQPTTLCPRDHESHYPPGQEPSANLDSGDACMKQGLKLEDEADNITDLVNHASVKRKLNIYKEAYRLFSLGGMLGCPESKGHAERLKARGYGTSTKVDEAPPRSPFRVSEEASIRAGVHDRPKTSQSTSPVRLSPVEFMRNRPSLSRPASSASGASGRL